MVVTTGFELVSVGSIPTGGARLVIKYAMENIYCRKLNLDVNLDLSELTRIQSLHTDKSSLGIFVINKDNALENFLKQFNLSIDWAEAFYTPPKGKLPIHLDKSNFSNDVKLNWVFGEGRMKWWMPKDSTSPLEVLKTDIKTSYILFNEQDCNCVWSEAVGKPSLVNSGIPHSVDNDSENGRWCLSYVIRHNNNGKTVQWEDAVKFFPQ